MRTFITRLSLLAIGVLLTCPSVLYGQETSDPAWYRRTALGENEIWQIAAVFASILAGLIVGKLLKHFLVAGSDRLEAKQRMYSAVALRSLVRVSTMACALVGLRVGLHFLSLDPVTGTVAETVISILAIVVVAYAAYYLVDVLDAMMLALAARTASKLDDMLRPLVRTSLRATIIVLALVQIATFLSDKPMTSVIAGLGVGGLAIALAGQDMVKNFFGSLMILSDHPFEMGDFVEAGGHRGSVESVGFRSTRLRTPDGHLVTIPNGSLANMVINNVSQRPFLKRAFGLGLTYDTSPQKVERAIEIVKDILQDHAGQSEDKPPLVNFTDFTDSTLNIQVTYWHFPADWSSFRPLNDHVNIEILRRFNEEQIGFAFPTQTIHMADRAATSN